MNDSNGKPIEADRLYAISKGSKSELWISRQTNMGLRFFAKSDGRYLIPSSIAALMEIDKFFVERLSDWTLRNNRESLLESLANIQERAAEANATLDALEREALELLHAGYTDESRDAILGFVRDRRGSPEEIAALVSAGS